MKLTHEMIQDAANRVIKEAQRQMLADSIEHTPERQARLIELVNLGMFRLAQNLKEDGSEFEITQGV